MYFRVTWIDEFGNVRVERYAAEVDAVERQNYLRRMGYRADVVSVRAEKERE